MYSRRSSELVGAGLGLAPTELGVTFYSETPGTTDLAPTIGFFKLNVF